MIRRPRCRCRPPVDHPEIVRLDAGSSSTLGLFYLKTVGSLKQIVRRSSTTAGNTWGAEAQLTSEPSSVFWHRVLNVDGTVYLFWTNSDTTGALCYQTTTDLSTWSARGTVGRTVGPKSSKTDGAFDVARLANGTWILAYKDRATTCRLSGSCNTYDYPALHTALGSDLATWGSPIQQHDPYDQRWPGTISMLQNGAGTVFLTWDRHQYPWGRYVRLKTGSADGTTWSAEVTFGCDPGIGCDGWQAVTAPDQHRLHQPAPGEADHRRAGRGHGLRLHLDQRVGRHYHGHRSPGHPDDPQLRRAASPDPHRGGHAGGRQRQPRDHAGLQPGGPGHHDTDPRGAVTTFGYDARGNLIEQVEDAGSRRLNLTATWRYRDDDLVGSVDARGAVTDYAYDAEHHPVSPTLHLGTADLTTTFSYWPDCAVHTTRDPNGQATGNVATSQYDRYGYLAEQTDAAGNIERFEYDEGGRLLSLAIIYPFVGS